MLRITRLICTTLAVVQITIPTAPVLAESPSAMPPSGYAIYSRLVGRWAPGKDTSGRYDLSLLHVPGNYEPARMTGTSEDKPGKLGAAVWYPAFSPDGTQVLFVANSPPGSRDLDLLESPTYRRQGLNLWIMSVKSGHLKPLTIDANGYDHFTWSRDGTWVAAAQVGWPPYYILYSWDLVKSKRYILTRRSKQESITDVFWDGKNVTFQLWSSKGRQDPNLYAIPRNGGKTHVLIKGRDDRSNYSFSPDRRHVAFLQKGAIYVAKANGTDPLPVIKPLPAGSRAEWSRPEWSSDSLSLAVAEVIPNKLQSHRETKIHVCVMVAGRDRVVAALHDNVTDVKWSRNGQWLILKTLDTGNTERPDPQTGWYEFHREGLLAVSVADGQVITLKKPDQETKGIDWFETN